MGVYPGVETSDIPDVLDGGDGVGDYNAVQNTIVI
jgi:hypothetical protein